MGFKIEQLVYLKDIIKYNSITKAAEMNFTVQSNLSKEIDKLEKDFGIKLLERTSKGTVPTEDYKNIEKYINTIMEAYDEIKKYSNQTKKSDINILVSYSINEYIVDYLMNWKIEDEKQIFVEKTFGNEMILAYLKEKKADFILFADWYHLSQDLSECEKIIFAPLFEEQTVVCIGPRSPFYHRQSLTVAEFLSMEQIITGSSSAEITSKLCYAEFGEVSAKFIGINDNYSILKHLSRTESCYWTHDSFEKNYQSLFEEFRLKAIPIEGYDKKIVSYLAYLKDKALTKDDLAFISYVKKYK